MQRTKTDELYELDSKLWGEQSKSTCTDCFEAGVELVLKLAELYPEEFRKIING